MAELQPIQVQEGVEFKPFENLRKFLPADLTVAYWDRKAVKVLEREIEFNGMKGVIEAYARPDMSVLMLNGPTHFLTPLAEILTVVSGRDGVVQVEELPVTLRSVFTASSQEQLELLNRFVLNYHIGRERFSIPQAFGKNYHDGLLLDIYSKRNARVFGELEVVNPMKEESTPILLPYNVGILGEVVASITRRTQGRFLQRGKWVDNP